MNYVTDYVSTEDLLPFGVINLHGWCGAESANCYPARNYSDINPIYTNSIKFYTNIENVNKKKVYIYKFYYDSNIISINEIESMYNMIINNIN